MTTWEHCDPQEVWISVCQAIGFEPNGVNSPTLLVGAMAEHMRKRQKTSGTVPGGPKDTAVRPSPLHGAQLTGCSIAAMQFVYYKTKRIIFGIFEGQREYALKWMMVIITVI